MKFKNDIELQAGLEDLSGSTGTSGQILSSTGTGTSWIAQDDIISAASKLVVIECKNTYTATILKGTPVYQTGTVGATDVIEVAPADALISLGYQPAIGLLQQDLAINEFGNVVITGELLNFTTDPIDGLTPVTGQKVFLKSGGGLTLTKPIGAGNGIQNLGLIGKVSIGNAGSITVSSIMRTNDVPNLPTGRIWVGDGNTIVSDTVYIDEPNNRVGIGTTSPQRKLSVAGSMELTTADMVLNVGNAAIRRGTAGEMFLDAPGDITVTIDTNNNNTDRIFNVRKDTGTELFRVQENGNVGIGTTSPGQKLTVEGDVGIRPAGRLYVNDIAAYSGSLTIGPTGASELVFRTTGSEKMRITSSGDVGIGTTSPLSILHIGTGTAANIPITFAPASGGNVDLRNTSSTGSFTFTNANGSSEKMRITGGGNVGIGTTSPGSKLQVNGEIDANGADGYRIEGRPWANWGTDLLTLGDWDGESYATRIMGSNSSEVMRVTGTNVGIGTTSPSSNLHVASTGNAEILTQRSSGAGVLIQSQSAVGVFGTNTNHRLDLKTNGSTRLTVNTAGNVGIGTTTPTARLHVYSTGNGTLNVERAAGALVNIQAQSAKGIIGTNSNHTFSLKTNSSERLIILSNGNVGIGSTNPTFKLDVIGSGRFTSTVTATNFIISSDERKKTEIKDLKVDTVDVQWKSFEMKDNEGEYRTGVIAQELEQKHPEFVNTDDEGYKSVKYIDLLIAKIAELEARLEKLENN